MSPLQSVPNARLALARRPPSAPSRIGLLNLMPSAEATEAQFAQVLQGRATLVPLRLSQPRGRTAAYHLSRSRPWQRAFAEGLDGLIVTGAPVETLPFEAVTYWPELCTLMDAARSRAMRTLYVCWWAHAALWHFHGVPKRLLPTKAFGVFLQQATDRPSPLLAGLGQAFPTPVSRHTEVREADLPPRLDVLARSGTTGLCLVSDPAHHADHLFNHLEYEAGTLEQEYIRDLASGRTLAPPRWEAGGPGLPAWRPFARQFYANWLEAAAAGSRLARCN